MRILTRCVSKVLRSFGLEFHKMGENRMGVDPFYDIKIFLPDHQKMIIFDVGANVGGMARKLKENFPFSSIHSFEPDSRNYQKLVENVQDLENVKTWNYALGSCVDQKTFLRNSISSMSSFLELGELGWGKMEAQPQTNILSVDQFCLDQKIDFIHLLKCDTQGYELEVLKGAREMIQKKCIGLVYLEMCFSEIYKELPRFDEIFRLLLDSQFVLVSWYNVNHQRRLASWSDLLFIHKSFYQQHLSTIQDKIIPGIPPEYDPSQKFSGP
jgi:FkbM family methyltransferase